MALKQKPRMESNINPVVSPDSESENHPINFSYLLKNLHWLWLQPNRFFTPVNKHVTTFAVVLCVYIMGITAVADRIDNELLKFYTNGRGSEMIIGFTHNWIHYWGFVLAAGVLAAGIHWLLWGWIFNLRIKWSGDDDVDPTQGRNIYSMVDLVVSLPYLIIMIVPVFIYPDYLTFYHHEEWWSTSLLLFVLWGFIAKFLVVIGQYNVVTWRAVILFLVLPISIFFGAVILIASL